MRAVWAPAFAGDSEVRRGGGGAWGWIPAFAGMRGWRYGGWLA